MKPEHPLTLQAQKNILLIRGHRVMLDFDLATLYGVETRSLKQAVRRNLDRFPDDFMFELDQQELALLLSQNVIPERRSLGGAMPMAFTEQGVSMLSSVLRSKRAIEVNIGIMRAFVRLRELLLSNTDLARKLDELERRYDSQFQVVFEAIRELMSPPDPRRSLKSDFMFRKTKTENCLEISTLSAAPLFEGHLELKSPNLKLRHDHHRTPRPRHAPSRVRLDG